MRAYILFGFIFYVLAIPTYASNKPTINMEDTMKAFELGFFSIPVTDMKVAKDFYGKVMGWEFQDRDSSFAYIFVNENMAGSLEMANEKFQPSEKGPLLFFRADFMKKTLARVTAAGGTVKEKQAMEGGARGYTAKILDPFKNTVAFWSPEN